MTDRFEQPERPLPGDPRRIFIPAPSGNAGSSAGAPPRPAPGGNGAGTSGGRVRPQGPGRNGPGDAYGRDPYGDPSARRGPGRDGRGPGGPAGAPPRSGRRFPRLRLRRVLLVIGILLVVCLVGGFLWVRSIFSGIERVETEGELAGGSVAGGTNYLIVGSDSREPVDGEQAGINDGDFPGGQRADTMLLMQVGGDGTKVTSIPRDLWVPIADIGTEGKINGAYNGGAPRLLRTIGDALDIPIHRYMEVDFVSFAGLVDGLGGITIDFPHPATDANSGLNVTGSGPVELDGEQALAYVRSRYYVEHINGEQVPEGTGDLGRVVRQQRFLTAVMGKLSDTKNPISLLRAFDGASDGLRIDDDMGLFDAIRLGWRLRSGLDPETLEIPTDVGTVGSASVLFLRDDAQAVLDEFR